MLLFYFISFRWSSFPSLPHRSTVCNICEVNYYCYWWRWFFFSFFYYCSCRAFLLWHIQAQRDKAHRKTIAMLTCSDDVDDDDDCHMNITMSDRDHALIDLIRNNSKTIIFNLCMRARTHAHTHTRMHSKWCVSYTWVFTLSIEANISIRLIENYQPMLSNGIIATHIIIGKINRQFIRINLQLNKKSIVWFLLKIKARRTEIHYLNRSIQNVFLFFIATACTVKITQT